MKKIIIVFAALVCGSAFAQTADNVLCSGCINAPDIKNGAVTTGKIKSGAVKTGRIADGAVTMNKVAPELKNSIGTYCLEGLSVVGIDTDGNLVCQNLDQPWRPLDFPISGNNVLNDCAGGEKFVRQSDFDGRFVGAQVCNGADFRYKLFLAESEVGPYWEMADGSGSGQDHCEVIGQDDGTLGTIESTVAADPSAYARNSRGQVFNFFTPPSVNDYRTSYYECGIRIPSGVEVDPPL